MAYTKRCELETTNPSQLLARSVECHITRFEFLDTDGNVYWCGVICRAMKD